MENVKLLRRIGFNERIIDMIWRMSNNWYSVIINGTRCDFIHSIRGLKQGDPFAPSFFIIGAELLSRMLNNLTQDQFFNGFYMERRGPQVNHLSFADDIIIFTSGGRASLQKIMEVEKLATNFFWVMEKDKNKYHWTSWQKPVLPTEEGGVSFRSMEDICQIMEYKKCWLFRTKESLWSKFLRAKFCQRSNPISKKWNSGQSQRWKKMMTNKKEAEKHIIWRLHSGNCSFWWDNWLGDGSLAQHRNGGERPDNVIVANF
ncbi:uncharacterized protein [Nicotiana tomentosiformis]|uniref:uncharacterized protein n=1 Tax=Nicotiana tomentosiformis TaxID=4098 RepID=UPI00388CC024